MQRWSGLIEDIRPGDVVSFEPGEKHWHGASANTAMGHIAIQEALNGSPVAWMEQVSDEQYGDHAGKEAFQGQALFFGQRRMLGGPAPVRRFLPDLMDRVLNGLIQPGKVFDLALPIDQVAEGYRAMDQRRAIKTLLTV